MPPRRRHLFFLFVALLLGGVGPTLARAQPSASCPTPTPHAARSRTRTTRTLEPTHATATPAPGPAATSEPPHGPQGDCQGVKDCCQPPAPTIINKLSCTEPRERAAHHKLHRKPPWSWPPTPIEVFTLLLFLVGVGQLGLYRAQQNLTKNLERPWIVAELVSDNVFDIMRAYFPIKGEKSPPTIDPLRLIQAKLTFKNYGRTPAWMVGSTVQFRPIEVAELSKPPPFRKLILTGAVPLPPNGTAGTDNGIYLCRDFSSFVCPAFAAGTVCLVLFGKVQFRDIWDRTDTMWFSWTWTQEGVPFVERRPGPPHWVRATSNPGKRRTERWGDEEPTEPSTEPT